MVHSDAGVSQSQDDSIVGTRQFRHSVAIMPFPGTLSSSSPDLLQPATSMLDFTNPAGKKQLLSIEISLFHILNYIFYFKWLLQLKIMKIYFAFPHASIYVTSSRLKKD